MSDDLSPRAIQIIGMMRRARDLDMPDMVSLEAMQSLAEVAAEFEDVLPEHAMCTLIGVGAMLSVAAEAEMRAGIETFFALGRAARA
jgi:hypothetical protein